MGSACTAAVERSSFWGSSRSYWALQGLGWGGLGTLWLAGAVLHPSFQKKDVLWALSFSVCGLGVSHALRMFARRTRLLERDTKGALILGAAGSLLLGAALAAAVNTIRLALYPEEFDLPTLPMTLLGSFGVASGMLGTWMALYVSYHQRSALKAMLLERAQLETALKTAEFEALRAKVNPHFLFNSLNTVRSLIGRDDEAAREAVTTLSDLLRASLSSSDKPLIPLSEELSIVEAYLRIEKLRLQERLGAEFSIAPETLDLKVPRFLLQTFVENAVRHGISALESGGRVEIVCRKNGERLELLVRNPRDPKQQSAPQGFGLGLKNARETLQRLFGAGATVTVEPGAKLFEARAELPMVAAG